MQIAIGHFIGDVVTALGGGGGAPAFNYYVDSVSGNDASPGSLAQPFQTLARAQTALTAAGTSLGLVKGSYWREQFNIPRNDFLIGVVGAGNPPVIDGRDIVVATWTQPDVGTYPNVWAVSWTRSSGAPSATELLGLWADGTRPRFASSLADLQTNGGWFATSRITASTTVYVKSIADPNGSGVVYQITKRDFGINGNAPSGTYTGTLTGPIEAIGCLGHYNSITGPGSLTTETSSVKQVLVRDGTIHHSVLSADAVEDIIAIEGYPSFGTQFIPLTAYRNEGVGFKPTWKRVLIEGIGNAQDELGFLTHASTNGGLSEAIDLEQVYITNCRKGIGASSQRLAVTGAYINGGADPAIEVNQAISEIKHSLVRNVPTIAGEGAVADLNSGTKSTLIENCAFFYTSAVAEAAPLIRKANAAGSLTVRNCVFFIEDTTNFNGIFNTSASLTSVNFEYNVFVLWPFKANVFVFGGTPTVTADHNIYLASAQRFSYNGISYGSVPLWQIASGQDGNSVAANPVSLAALKSTYFQGDPASGDFRLKSGIGTFGDGVSLNLAGPQAHWDWNLRAQASGAPSRWPVPPANLSEYRGYIADSAAWNFYP